MKFHSSLGHLGCSHSYCISHFLYPFICWWAPWPIPHIAIVNSAVINMGVQVLLLDAYLPSFGYIPQSGAAESYGSSNFSFFEEPPYLFPSGCTNLHSHKQCLGVPFPSHPHQHLWFVFSMIACLDRVRWNLNVVSIFISIMANDLNIFHVFIGYLFFF
jgi:hypothetical protein